MPTNTQTIKTAAQFREELLIDLGISMDFEPPAAALAIVKHV